MKRRPEEPEVWGAAEASQCLGVGQTNLRKVSGFASIVPYQKIEAATLWRATEIKALAWERGSKPKDSTTTQEDTQYAQATPEG